MAIRPTPVVDEHDLYPIHEEESVPQGPVHFRQSGYLCGTLEPEFPNVLMVACCSTSERLDSKRRKPPAGLSWQMRGLRKRQRGGPKRNENWPRCWRR